MSGHRWGAIARAAAVRLRFPALLAMILAVVLGWDTLSTHFWRRVDRWIGAPSDPGGVSSSTEYFCPMDPGVLSDWPSRCPICNMTLVRRERGDMAPLPNGVLARVQLSPYRVQLAGIAAAEVDYRPLEKRPGGPVRSIPEDPGMVSLELFADEAGEVREGMAAEVDAGGGPLAATVVGVERVGAICRARLRIDVPLGGLPNSGLKGAIKLLAADLPRSAIGPANLRPCRRASLAWRIGAPPIRESSARRRVPARTTAGLARVALAADRRLRWWCPMHPGVTAEKPGASCDACGGMKLVPRIVAYAPPGRVLAVPESAVIDTGTHKVVYLERMPGVYEAVEVKLGPRPAASPTRSSTAWSRASGSSRRALPRRRRDAADARPRGRLLRRHRDRRLIFAGPSHGRGDARQVPRDRPEAGLDGRAGFRRDRRPDGAALLRRLQAEAGGRPGSLPGRQAVGGGGEGAVIDRLIDWSIRRRWLVIGLGLLLAAAGAWSAAVAPVDAIPDLSENQVIVSADWPGHAPLEVDSQVAGPLSNAFRGVRGVKDVRSSSDVGYAWLSIIFDDSVSHEDARRSIADRLANASIALPNGVAPKLAPDSSATGQIFWYTVEGGALDPGRLRGIQDGYVRGQLASVPGVAEVASVGGWPIEFQVELDPDRLREYGLVGDDVRKAVERADAVAGAHVLLKGGAEYTVRASTRLGQSAPDERLLAEVRRELELAPVPLPDGGSAPLSRLASIAVGPGPRRGSLEKDGNEAVGGVVLMAHGENPRAVTDRIKRKIRELDPGLPPGVKVVPFYDRTP
ncbi:MAG: efflux RND transporter permease subunit [Isosphaeraceae bacterium]